MLRFSKGDCAGDYAIEEQVQRCGGVGGTKVQSAECRVQVQYTVSFGWGTIFNG